MIEHIKGETAKIGRVIIIGWCIGVAGYFLPNIYGVIVLFSGILIFFFGFFWFRSDIKCPKCNVSIGKLVPAQLNILGCLTGKPDKFIEFCPSCGENFDEQMGH